MPASPEIAMTTAPALSDAQMAYPDRGSSFQSNLPVPSTGNATGIPSGSKASGATPPLMSDRSGSSSTSVSEDNRRARERAYTYKRQRPAPAAFHGNQDDLRGIGSHLTVPRFIAPNSMDEVLQGVETPEGQTEKPVQDLRSEGDEKNI